MSTFASHFVNNKILLCHQRGMSTTPLVPVQIRNKLNKDLRYDTSSILSLSPKQKWISCSDCSNTISFWRIADNEEQVEMLTLKSCLHYTWMVHIVNEETNYNEDVFFGALENGDLVIYIFHEDVKSNLNENVQFNRKDVIWSLGGYSVSRYLIPSEGHVSSITLASLNHVLTVIDETMVNQYTISNDALIFDKEKTLRLPTLPLTEKSVPDKYQSLDATENYLFALRSMNPTIDVYDLRTKILVGSIDISILDSTTKNFTKLQVSRDSLVASVVDSYNCIFVIELDKFFQPITTFEGPINEEDEYYESDSGDEGIVSNFSSLIHIL